MARLSGGIRAAAAARDQPGVKRRFEGCALTRTRYGAVTVAVTARTLLLVRRDGKTNMIATDAYRAGPMMS